MAAGEHLQQPGGTTDEVRAGNGTDAVRPRKAVSRGRAAKARGRTPSKQPGRSAPRAIRISSRWRKRFKLIPGYDPIATAAPGEWFDEAAAEKVVKFFELYVTHIEGKDFAGKPFKLEPWQEAIVGCVFGWKRPDGTRRYREVFQYVPRKNGKTTFCAGIINVMALLDREPGAQLYSCAAEKEQATLLFRQIRGQINNKPELAKRARIYGSLKSIEYEEGITYKALSADADTKHGFNTQAVIVDELHAHRDASMLDVMTTSTGSRLQPIVWIITTADFDRPSICNQKYDYAIKVRDGVVDDSAFLPIIFEADRDADWTDREVWAIANPNLGISIRVDYLERECKKALATPAYENTFRRLHLNQRTEQDVRLIPMAQWDAGRRELTPDMLAALRDRPCFGALDIGATSDFSAFVLGFPEPDGLLVLPWFWLPEKPRRRDQRMQDQIEAWGRAGFITRTPGSAVDLDRIVRDIAQLGQRFAIQEVAADPWNAIGTMNDLYNEGFKVIQFRQGYASMSGPTKRMMDLLAAGTFCHDGNPVLRWMAGNAAGETDSHTNLKISKKRSTEKVDGIVAAVMALGRVMANDTGLKASDVLAF